MVEEEDNVSNVLEGLRNGKGQLNRPEPNSQNTILTRTTTANDGNKTIHQTMDMEGK